jgi:hypothetical protein
MLLCSLQVEEVLSYARIRPVANQIELHPLLAQRKLLGVCRRKVSARTSEGQQQLWQQQRQQCVFVAVALLPESALTRPLLLLTTSAIEAVATSPAFSSTLHCATLWLQGVHSVAYSPLGHVKDSDVMGHPAVAEVAAETGKTPAQVREPGGTRLLQHHRLGVMWCG